MEIAVIDNWISKQGLQELSGRSATIYKVVDGKVLPQAECAGLRSHGTICAAILADTLPDTTELTVVSIAGEADGTIMLGNLYMVLAWFMKCPPDYLC